MEINMTRKHLSRIANRTIAMIVAASSLTIGSAVAVGATPLSLSAVSNLAVSQVTNTSMHVAWSIPANEVALSVIEVQVTNGAGTAVAGQTLSSSATSADVSGLTPDTSLTVTVIASDTDTPPNVASTAVSTKTLKNPASAVSNFAAVPNSQTGTSMDLSWTAPTNIGSGLSGYTVTCSPSCTIANQPNGNATSLTIANLTPTNSYTFTIVANTSDGQSGAAATAVGNFAPTAPQSLQVSQQTLSTALLTWTAPSYLGSGLNGYTVSCSPSCTIASQPNANATSLLVSGLNYSQSYTFSVIAKATDLQLSTPATATASTSSTIGVVQSLSVTAPTASSLRATWSAPAGSASYLTFYRAYCYTGVSTSCGSATVNPSPSPSVTFQSSQQYPIIPTTSYTIYVLAYAVNGSSSPTYVSASVSTPVSTNPAPTAVVGLSISSQTSTSISLSWSAPGNLALAGALNGYTITCSPTCTIANQPGPNATSLVVTGLSPATRYTFTIIANSADLKNSPAATIAGNTKFSSVTNFTASAPSTTSVRLDWTAPAAGTGVARQGYVVSCTPSCTIASQPGANATSLIVTGLSSGVSYSFAIVAVGTDTLQSTSATTSLSTNYLAPGSVRSFTATAQTSTSVQLTWAAPAQVGSGLSGYTVNCTPSCTIASQPGANDTSLVITGLTAGQGYTFSIVANSTDTQSSSSVQTYAVGSATVLSSAQVTSTSATLTWTAPSNLQGGAAILSYLYVCTPSVGSAVNGISSSATALITGLSPNTLYSCVVSANDVNGNTSVASSPETFTTMHVAPSAATGLTATTQSTTSVLLDWTAPTQVGSGLSGYTVTCTPSCTIASQPGANATQLLITGLTPGVSYSFTLVANGTDTQNSVSATASARTVTGAPTNMTASASSASSVLLNWTPPTQVGSGLSGYTVTCTPSCTIASQPGANATSLTVTGLTAGQSYTFSIVANATGTQSSAAATASVRTLYLAPSAPRAIAAVAQTTSSVNLSWTVPAQVGSGLSGYTVTCTPSCTIASQPGANDTSLVITGLTSGTLYTFSVVANASDSQNSSAATASARTAYAAPGAVTGLTATAQSTSSVLLNWTAAAANGSASLNGYTVTCTPSCTIASQPGANATGALITGLTPNTSYTFSIVANASDAQSSGSATSSAVLTASAPGQLVSPSNSVTTTTATVSWSAPIGSGNAIVGYVVTCSPTCGSTQVLSGTATSVNLTGLTPNSAYVVSIVAQSLSGNTTTTVNLSTAKTAPGAVTGLSATAQSTSSVLLNWTAAAANGSASLNGYTVTCTPSCTIASQPGANATSLTVTGLTGGTNYTFSIVANASDSQNSSAATASASTVAYTAPGAVTGVTATATAANSVTLSWTAPQNVGAGVAGYFVTCSPACSISNPVAAQLRSVLIAGLTGGRSYTFTILTQDSNGQYSTAASASTTTPFGAPGAVTGVTATQPSTGTVILRWKAPVNVGAGITSYKITYTQNGKIVTKSVTGLTTTLSGLTKVAHVFSIVANASNGVSSTTSTVSLLVR